MDVVLIVSMLATLGMACLGVLAVWALLRALDVTVGFKFGEWLNDASELAVAVYLGCRFVGVCLLVGLLFS